MVDGVRQPTAEGTPQGSPLTPPTQQRTFAHVTLRVDGVVAAAAGGWFPDRDAVADGEFLGSGEDVLDDGAQDALAVPGAGGGRVLPEPGEEALEVAGQLEVGVAVGGPGVEGSDLVLQARLAGAQGGHAGAELVDRDELLGERGDHRADRLAGLGEGLLELAALLGDRVGRAVPLRSGWSGHCLQIVERVLTTLRLRKTQDKCQSLRDRGALSVKRGRSPELPSSWTSGRPRARRRLLACVF